MSTVLHFYVSTAFIILQTRILSFSLLSTLSFLCVLYQLKKLIVIIAVDEIPLENPKHSLKSLNLKQKTLSDCLLWKLSLENKFSCNFAGQGKG